jgi:hypothetical protein
VMTALWNKVKRMGKSKPKRLGPPVERTPLPRYMSNGNLIATMSLRAIAEDGTIGVLRQISYDPCDARSHGETYEKLKHQAYLWRENTALFGDCRFVID